MSQIIAQNLF